MSSIANELDLRFMRMALKEAHKAIRTGDVPVGAIVVCDGIIVAKARNTKEKLNLTTRHAEINAIEKASKKMSKWRLTGCTIYVTMEPCPMCAGALHQARVSRIVYGARDLKHGACGSLMNLFEVNGLNHYPEVKGGVLETECAQVLKDFFSELRQNKNRDNKKS